MYILKTNIEISQNNYQLECIFTLNITNSKHHVYISIGRFCAGCIQWRT